MISGGSAVSGEKTGVESVEMLIVSGVSPSGACPSVFVRLLDHMSHPISKYTSHPISKFWRESEVDGVDPNPISRAISFGGSGWRVASAEASSRVSDSNSPAKFPSTEILLSTCIVLELSPFCGSTISLTISFE